jgi:hypothetical protein
MSLIKVATVYLNHPFSVNLDSPKMKVKKLILNLFLQAAFSPLDSSACRHLEINGGMSYFGAGIFLGFILCRQPDFLGNFKF